MNYFLGLGKTLFNSSASLIHLGPNSKNITIVLSERLLRKKAAGAWPRAAILTALGEISETTQPVLSIAENRDVTTPDEFETFLDSKYPFYATLEADKLSSFSKKYNPSIKTLSHHCCHAYAALIMSPFEQSLILVMDGAGSTAKTVLDSYQPSGLGEQNFIPADLSSVEEYSVYTQNKGQLRCAQKQWQTLNRTGPKHLRGMGDGLGLLYEKCSEYIFNDSRAAGKVMGLAALGTPSPIENRKEYLNSLDWGKAFSGKTKLEWEQCENRTLYENIAASVQSHFESSLISLIKKLKIQFPSYDNLILVGGCALNCTTNMKLVETGLFESIYIPPFPGDEGISIGAASCLLHENNPDIWNPLTHENQNGYFGPGSSVPTSDKIFEKFKNYKISTPTSIAHHCAELLSKGSIIGWFQGRSETGPRALGNRSILADVRIPHLKDCLNKHVKFREDFRPYGCSIRHELADQYFEVAAGFDNPYMSFATKTRPAFRDLLSEVTHKDGTSRMQTVRMSQNPLFHSLLTEFGSITGIHCLLNTSLNIMGQPILETLEDARLFLDTGTVHGLAIGNHYIEKQNV